MTFSRIVLQQLAATVLVAPLLVIGVLTFPTSCTCGAATSHAHALFQLSNHTHAEHHVSGPDPDIGAASGYDTVGPHLEVPTTGGTAAQVGSLGTALAGPHFPTQDQARVAIARLVGQALTPLSPPPRFRPFGTLRQVYLLAHQMR